jgi:hypothetical protein
LQIFKDKLTEFKENPAKKSDEVEEYLKFLSHVSGVFKEEVVEFLSSELLNML